MFADTRALEWNETINVQMIMGQFNRQRDSMYRFVVIWCFSNRHNCLVWACTLGEAGSARKRREVVKWANSKQVNKIYYKLHTHKKVWYYNIFFPLHSRQFIQGRWNEPLRQIEFNAMKINEINLKCCKPNWESDVVAHGSMGVRHLSTVQTQLAASAADRKILNGGFWRASIRFNLSHSWVSKAMKQWHWHYQEPII